MKMNAGNRKKSWLKYCLDSKIKDFILLDSAYRAELRETKDKANYNHKMLVIICFCDDKVVETISENIHTHEEILAIWEDWKK